MESWSPASLASVEAVTARGLRKQYGEHAALDGVDLVVHQGRVHGLLGPNGAGKTTLLRVLLGLVRPDAGTVEVTGTVGGFVETPGAYPYLTGRQNLAHLAALDVEPGDVDEVLQRVGLADRADTRVRGWSLGMRQRLGIAAGLLRRPDLLVLDEPANGLDPVGALALRALVRDLARDGLTVLLCSHDQHGHVVGGRVVWDGTTPELRRRPGASLLSTSDDDEATRLARDLDVQPHPSGCLLVRATTEELDSYVLELARHGVAVRELVREGLPLEQAFLELAT